MYPFADYPKKVWDERLGWFLIGFFVLGIIALLVAAEVAEQRGTFDIYAPAIQR